METFEVDHILRLVPHQNNVIYTKFGAFKKKVLKHYQEQIQYQLVRQVQMKNFKKICDSFVKITYLFYYKVNDKKSMSDFHDLYTTQRGDYTNIAKSVDDAINGVLYDDDKQIIDSRAILLPARDYKITIMIKPVNIVDYDKYL